MHYRQLGKSGLRTSVIGLGTNQFGGKVDQAGVNEIISGATKLSQVQANAKAADWQLSADELSAVNTALNG